MNFTLVSVQKGQIIEPPRILLYSVEGIGKTTWASHAPNPIFIFTEKGRGRLSLDSFPLAQSWGDVTAAFRSLASEEHDYETVVIDTVDWLEKLIWEQTCTDGGKDSIEDFGYGKGYVQALKYWGQFLDALNELHEARGMATILLGHAMVKTFNNPDGDNYDQYQLAMHQKAAAMLKEWVDVVLFANYEVKVRKNENAIDKSKGKAVKVHGDIPRLMHTEERPAFWAKNRYGLPATLPLSWDAFADAMDAGIEKTEKVVEKLNAKADNVGRKAERES
jgi:AAA domain